MTSATRRKVIAGNWKMNKTVSEALTLVRELRGLVSMVRDQVEIVVAPPALAVASVAKALEDSNIKVAGQNCHWEAAGAYTGEISAAMLKEAGCAYVIVGHSERRQFFGETDETVSKRVGAALKARLLPIVCVGETLSERESQRTLEVVTRQVKGGLAGLGPAEMDGVVLAYEPVWAIGTGKTATSDQAQEVHAHIRKVIRELFGEDVAAQTRLQYGGSVKPENAKELLGKPDVDGALVGGASLKAGDFTGIIKACV